MDIEVFERNVKLTSDQKALISRRLEFALGRFEMHLGNIQATFCDLNGPRGGCDLQCRLQVSMRVGRELLVSEVGETVEASITAAADRAARTIARRLQRSRDRRGLSMSGDPRG